MTIAIFISLDIILMNERSVKLPYHVIFDFVKFLSKGRAPGVSQVKKTRQAGNGIVLDKNYDIFTSST